MIQMSRDEWDDWHEKSEARDRAFALRLMRYDRNTNAFVSVMIAAVGVCFLESPLTTDVLLCVTSSGTAIFSVFMAVRAYRGHKSMRTQERLEEIRSVMLS